MKRSEIENPVSQTTEAVKGLLTYMHRPVDPMPEFVELNNRVRLTLSKDRKAYYMTTTKDCSCPARAYHPETTCKHMKALQVDIEKREDDSILPKITEPFRPYVDEGPVKVRNARGEVI